MTERNQIEKKVVYNRNEILADGDLTTGDGRYIGFPNIIEYPSGPDFLSPNPFIKYTPSKRQTRKRWAYRNYSIEVKNFCSMWI